LSFNPLYYTSTVIVMPTNTTSSPTSSEIAALHERIADLEAENLAIRTAVDRHSLTAMIRFLERRLQDGETLFRTIVDAMPDGYMLFTHPDADGFMRLLDCNVALCHAHGMPREQLIGIRSGALAEDPLSNEERFAQSKRLLNGERIVNESVQRRADGTTFAVEVASINVQLGGQNLILAIARDITQRRQTELALRELNRVLEDRVTERTAALRQANECLAELNGELLRSRNLFSTIVDHLDIGLALLDHKGMLLAANSALGQMLEQPVEPMLNRSWATLPLSNFDPLQTESMRLRFMHLNGKQLVFDLSATRLRVSHTHEHMVLVKVIDTTEKLYLEAAMLQNERLAASGRMAAIVAHEVNTPLQVIQNLLYLVETTQSGRERYMTLLQDEVRRVGAIMRRLLDLNEAGSGNWNMIDCNEVIERVILLTELLLNNHHISVVRDLGAKLPAIWANADALTQVLLNLVVNAADAMTKGGVITICSGMQTLEGGTQYLYINVSDTGEGIDPKYIETIFHPFFTTKHAGHGTGIGLSVSRRIVQEHGGTIAVQSIPGQGATFSVYLPIIASQYHST
jgi:PAS domain S-box-containing protein